jgi:glucan phosphorylase
MPEALETWPVSLFEKLLPFLKQRHRPGLQRFRHQRMIGIGAGILRYLPRLLPWQVNDDITLLAQHVAIQLNDTHPALAVVELMRILVGWVSLSCIATCCASKVMSSLTSA